MKNIFYFRAFTVFYLILIYYISSLSQPVKLPSFPGIDKLIHFFEFGFLGYLIFNSIKSSNKNKKEFFSIIFSIFYAGLDEFHQYFVPGRNCDWADFMVDSLGIVFAVLTFSKLEERA